MHRTWTILATLAAALVVSMGSAGLRALHVATAPEHAAHHAGHTHSERAATSCGHSHAHACGSEREAPVHHSHSHGPGSHGPGSHGPGSHDADCATCELLTTLASDIAMPELAADPTGAAGDVLRMDWMRPAMRTLASVRARPPPAA